MVAEDFLQDPQVRHWLGGVEPAWTLLTFESLRALRQEPSAVQTAIRIVPGSSFFILSNDLSEILRGGQTCCSDVVVIGDPRIPMVQKCAGEMRVLTAVGSGT